MHLWPVHRPLRRRAKIQRTIHCVGALWLHTNVPPLETEGQIPLLNPMYTNITTMRGGRHPTSLIACAHLCLEDVRLGPAQLRSGPHRILPGTSRNRPRQALRSMGTFPPEAWFQIGNTSRRCHVLSILRAASTGSWR